ncbi:hypothetical protein BGZ65_000203 [Modicella reniformis]|uniref:Uncharacterized protein n=1 Tax=Modicella reniformis TaxID=1440133 RepID=A0A9P6M5T6_9FUNG|nr:hypothetical protein BGZ65_000203 [Modicella reniformis]
MRKGTTRKDYADAIAIFADCHEDGSPDAHTTAATHNTVHGFLKRIKMQKAQQRNQAPPPRVPTSQEEQPCTVQMTSLATAINNPFQESKLRCKPPNVFKVSRIDAATIPNLKVEETRSFTAKQKKSEGVKSIAKKIPRKKKSISFKRAPKSLKSLYAKSFKTVTMKLSSIASRIKRSTRLNAGQVKAA